MEKERIALSQRERDRLSVLHDDATSRFYAHRTEHDITDEPKVVIFTLHHPDTLILRRQCVAVRGECVAEVRGERCRTVSKGVERCRKVSTQSRNVRFSAR
jgi:hypothetical protein